MVCQSEIPNSVSREQEESPTAAITRLFDLHLKEWPSQKQRIIAGILPLQTAETAGLPRVYQLALSSRARSEQIVQPVPLKPRYGSRVARVLAGSLRETACLLLSLGALLYRCGNELSTPLGPAVIPGIAPLEKRVRQEL
jgi:hypothetical protein